MKLAIILILYLAITSALSTLIPQGKEISFYYANYSPALARIIEAVQFHTFFRSFLFLFPLLLFFINLLVCAVDRMAKRLRSKARKKFGPDIVHIGLLLLMISGLIGLFGREESMVWLMPGESTLLPDEYELVLKSFEFQKYEDGRPKDWLSQVEVMRDGQLVKTHTIEVNHPLSIGRLKVFQNSYSQEITADISDFSGEVVTIRPDDYYFKENSMVIFRTVETGETTPGLTDDGPCSESGIAVFEELSASSEGSGHEVIAVHRVGIGERIGVYTIEKLCISSSTGLQVVEDSSVVPLIVSLVLIGLGMSLTFVKTMGDKNI